MRGKLQELVGEIERKDHTIETLESDLRRARGEAEVRYVKRVSIYVVVRIICVIFFGKSKGAHVQKID